jgi:NADPH2:quinone reductase
MKSIVMSRTGGPEVLSLAREPDPVPGAGQVLVAVRFAGVNFMDIGVRQNEGFWPEVAYPKRLGVEGSGEVLALGEGVGDFTVGQRVAWVYAPGSYADKVVIPAGSLVAVPDEIDDRTAAAVMMQGLTASHFATDFHPVQPGEVALVHAAAGGLGTLLTQIIKIRGGKVIGRVSSPEKVHIAALAGADHVIVDKGDDFSTEVLRLTDGAGVDVVYDGSGPKTFKGSVASLGVSGTFAWFGPVLGGPGSLDIMSLPRSIKIGYAVFAHHVSTPESLRARTRQLFDWILAGRLKIVIGGEFALEDAAKAHIEMESRASMGKLLLVP